jgi:D-alanyl-D-alanine carboxypeptidase
VRRASVFGLATIILLAAASSGAAAPRWKRKLHRATSSKTISVRVVRGSDVLFDKRSRWKRTPASNEKLLLSMALLDRLGPNARFPTTAFVDRRGAPNANPSAPNIFNGVLYSNVYVVGRGDPTLTGPGSSYGRALSVRATRLGGLARGIKRAGVDRIVGRVVGVRSYFRHDWMAPGWKPDFPAQQVALPSALTINGNVRRGRHIDNPEWRVARALTRKLEAMKIAVKRPPKRGNLPRGVTRLAQVESRPLRTLLGHMNRLSSNYFAEVFAKRLAVESASRPGTISAGAKALRRWVRRRGVEIRAFDGSGLSYANRVSARGIVRLLARAERARWGADLFNSLPKGGWGTLSGRLADVRLRAKTGTLENVSSLSGWLWLRRSERWARFSIMITGRPSWDAKAIEDRIVRLVASHG